MTVGRYYKGRNGHSRTLVPRTKNSSLTIGGAIRVSGRFAIGMRRQVRTRARVHTLQAPARVAASPGLAKYYFFTFYGGRKFVRFVAPLRRGRRGETRRIKMSLFADASARRQN